MSATQRAVYKYALGQIMPLLSQQGSAFSSTKTFYNCGSEKYYIIDGGC